jgi:cytochrome c oxidase assembly protein subunit 15
MRIYEVSIELSISIHQSDNFHFDNSSVTMPQPTQFAPRGRSILFSIYAWSVLALNLLVILWGAVVRATSSGAGCGEHWPLCNGSVIPHAATLATLIEYAHRLSSGVIVVATLGLTVWSFFRFKSGDARRLLAGAALLLMFTEGAFGAALVLLGHVARNTSPWRALTLSLHLCNTLLLLAALAGVAWFSGKRESQPVRIAFRGVRRGWLNAALIAFLLTATTGGVAALADSLFPPTSLWEGLRQDLSPHSHVFLRLRVFHPMVVVALGLTLLIVFAQSLTTNRTVVRRLGAALLLMFAGQCAVGATNMALLTPLWTQVLHLLLADCLWITLAVLYLEFGAKGKG